MITWLDVAGSDIDETAARRLFAEALTIAPPLALLDGDAKETALAVIRGAAAEVPAPGARRVRSQSRNGTSVTFDPAGSPFSGGDRAVLRSLCGMGSPGGPVGQFPPSTITRGIWPPEATA